MRFLALALASAALVSAAHRPWGPGWVALIAYLPLLAALDGKRSWQRGALAAWIASLGTGLVAFEGVAPAEFWAYPVLAAIAGLWLAIAGAAYVLIANGVGRRAALWSFPALLLVSEYLPAQRWLFGNFANGMSGFGYTQFDTPLMGLAGWSGVTGVSAVLLVANVVLYEALRRRRFLPVVALSAAVAAAILLPVPGADAPVEDVEPLRVGIVQGAVSSVDSLMARFDRDAAVRMIEPYAELTARAAERGADLVVWGETAIPHALRPGHVPAYVADALAPAPTALVGGVSFVEGRSYNSAFHWQDGGLTEVYRKRALVPVNEARYTPGVPLPPLAVNGTAVGMGICLGSVFGSLARESADAGAQLLVYLTEDSFAGRTVTPELHLRVTAFRAAETGRYTVFANQSGPSAVFDHRGRALARLPLGETAGTLASVVPHQGRTPFVRFGDWVGAAAMIVSLAWLVTGVVGIASGPRTAGGPRRRMRDAADGGASP